MLRKFMGTFDSLRRHRPGEVTRSGSNLVEIREPTTERGLPLMAVPRVKDVDLLHWVELARDIIDQALTSHGAILFRGFSSLDDTAFGKLLEARGSKPMEYIDQHTPRSGVEENVYTSTEYPAEEDIELHSEMSYSALFPRDICFYCRTPPTHGGSTPICDNGRVLELIDPQVRCRFIERKIRYVRNFGNGVGLSWQRAFNTEEPPIAEEFCTRNGISVEWLPGNRLRTSLISEATITDPGSGKSLWFNQAHAFHYSSLPSGLRASLAASLPESEYPSNAYFGDGSAIAEDDLNAVRKAYKEASVRFAWQRDDALLLDNLRISHGRDAFRGERRILVSLGGAVKRAVS